MNTYAFDLVKANMRKVQFLPAVDLRAAKQRLARDLANGWSIFAVCENGILLSETSPPESVTPAKAA
jgi:hypothetical protein